MAGPDWISGRGRERVRARLCERARVLCGPVCLMLPCVYSCAPPAAGLRESRRPAGESLTLNFLLLLPLI